MSRDREEDDGDAVQRAFQEYMLRGKNHVSVGKADELGTIVQKMKDTEEHRTRNEKVALGKVVRQYKSIGNAFNQVLVNNWLSADDHASAVIHSIANLRDRVYLISRDLRTLKQAQEERQRYGVAEPPWKGNGYRRKTGTRLTRTDLELALSHDLTQHERMLAGLRSALVELQQAQDGMGRRLDELLALYNSSNLRYWSRVDTEEVEKICALVERCEIVYKATSNEVFRKQCLAEDVVSSTTDSILFREPAILDVSSKRTPQSVAQHCANQWSRGSTQSFLSQHVGLIEEICAAVASNI
jgi:hypothetical protein